MSISSKILPALALAISLSPLAAQARSDHQPSQAQHGLVSLHNDPVIASSATIDNPMVIYSDRTASKFPVSAGG